MKTSNEYIERSYIIDSGFKILYQVYGMDEEGTNFLYKTEERDNFKEANESYEKIPIQGKESKYLKLIIVDKNDLIVAEEFLRED